MVRDLFTINDAPAVLFITSTITLLALNTHYHFFLALGCIVIIGIPHGALDPWIGLTEPSLKNKHTWLFFLVYTAIAMLTCLLWFILPYLSLALFLLISAHHFGSDWFQGSGFNNVHCIAQGGIILSLPVLTHSSETLFIFNLLTDGNLSDLRWFFGGWLTLGLISCILTRSKGVMIELVFLVLLSLYTAPLTFFACYFCVLHSLRHYIRYGPSIFQQHPQRLPLLILVILVTYLLGWILFWSLPEHRLLEEKLLQVLFWGLSSLTVPHMLLVARKEKLMAYPSQ